MSLRSGFGRARTAAALMAAGLPGSVAVAPSAAAPADFVVSEAWIRVTIPSRPAAGYFKLTNNTDADARLVGAASPGCAAMTLHETVDNGGAETMRKIDEIPVPAHGSARFAPGGYHLMCMSPSAMVALGQRVPVTLKLAGGGEVSADFLVRGATER